MKERTPDFGHVFVDRKMALELERVFVLSEQLHTTQHNAVIRLISSAGNHCGK
jgi:hypothetical protein